MGKALRTRPPLRHRSCPGSAGRNVKGGGAYAEDIRHQPLAEAASDPWVGIVAVAMRGYSRPPRCG